MSSAENSSAQENAPTPNTAPRDAASKATDKAAYKPSNNKTDGSTTTRKNTPSTRALDDTREATTPPHGEPTNRPAKTGSH